MPAANLNQCSEALPELCSSANALLGSLIPPVFACSAVQSFGSDNVCCPNASLFLWCSVLSFYRLEQAPNTVIYAMSKRGDSNEAV